MSGVTMLTVVSSDRLSLFCIYRYVYIFVFFFFFQAEDGIRDLTVTGVQTCALPILFTLRAKSPFRRPQGIFQRGPAREDRRRQRSEERRVGKECRSRWSPYH